MKAVSGIPTCYIFACPVNPDDYMTPPLHALIPYGVGREPGLLLMNHAGKVRLWDSISIGLAGGGNYTEASLNLGPYETVSHLVRTHVRSSLFPVFFPLTRSASYSRKPSSPPPRRASSSRLCTLLSAASTISPSSPSRAPRNLPLPGSRLSCSPRRPRAS